MRPTLNIPESLPAESKKQIRRKRIEELRSMLGTVKLDIDIPASRRRPQRP